MTTITLPPDLEAWARAEVASGRAGSVEAVVAKGLRGYRLGIDTFRKSLDDARSEADRDGWMPGDAFMRELDQWVAELSLAAEHEEAAGKAAKWLRAFGDRATVPSAVLSGVFKPTNLETAQQAGLSLFWAFRLQDLADFVASSKS